MYKICYNDKIIRLLHIDLNSHLPESDDHYLKALYPGKTKFLLNYLDKVEKSKDLKHIDILSPNPKLTLLDFKAVCKVVKAAGGLVVNDSGRVLMIHRRGSWDLPKGKMEQGETKKISAIREVKEETGLTDVRLLSKLITTFHIYRIKSSQKRILKPSYWYLMKSNQKHLVPQTEEDIERAEWMKVNSDSLQKLQPIYANIKDVLKAYIDMSSTL